MASKLPPLRFAPLVEGECRGSHSYQSLARAQLNTLGTVTCPECQQNIQCSRPAGQQVAVMNSHAQGGLSQ